MKNKILEWARWYKRQGYNPIPIRIDEEQKNKKAAVKWERYQTEKVTDEEIEAWFSLRPCNIALVTGQISKLAVIDIDLHRAPRESLEKFNQTIPPDIQVPTVLTPNGGKHLWFRMNGIELRGATDRPKGIDLRAEGNYIIVPPSIGANGKYYAWVNKTYNIPLINIPDAYINNYIMGGEGSLTNVNTYDNKAYQNVSKHIINLNEGGRDESLYHTAICLKNGGMSKEDATQLIGIIAKNCNPPFPINDALEKIKSAYERSLPSERNITAEIKNWISISNGIFHISECIKDCDLATKYIKSTARMVFSRLVKEGLIERVGNKHGMYRRIEKQCDLIDWKSADISNIFDVKWPFELEKLVTIYPKNICIIAGSSNAGKTAYLLNFILKNMEQHFGNIHYFSSEMGPEELKLRLQKFEVADDIWNGFHPYDRSSQFSDAIVPDAINIIDYLELTDNFFAVGGEIKAIYDKLGKGIAIIAIQKKAGTDLGRGAEFTLEKARLYLSIEHGQLKIVKAKNWKQKDRNPNGRIYKFFLVQGCKFSTSENPLSYVEE